MSEVDVVKALQKAAVAACEIAAPDLPIQAMGRKFDVPANFRFWEIVVIPNGVAREAWDGSRVLQGNMRVMLHWSINDEGVYPAMAFADAVINQFPKDHLLRESNIAVKIYSVPTLGSTVAAGNELIFPVTIPYRSFQPEIGI